MKKIVLLSLMMLSCNLFGNEDQNGQQSQVPTIRRAILGRTQQTPNRSPHLHQRRQRTPLSQADRDSLRAGFRDVRNIIAHEPNAQQIAAQRLAAQ